MPNECKPAANCHCKTEQLEEAVRFTLHAPEAQSVFLVGTFNGWNEEATPMERCELGEWMTSLPLAPGRYEYKFVIDGEWVCAPGPDEQSFESPGAVPNEYGTWNRVLEVT